MRVSISKDNQEKMRKVVQAQPAPLWRNRDYLLLWSGQIISSVGTQVSQLAFPLLVLTLSHSAAQAGFVGALRVLPYLIFSLPAGTLIDRWDRKRVMILCDAARALSLASVPFAFAFGRLSVAQLYVVSLLEGTFFVFFDIAEVSCLPRVVAAGQLPTAVAQNQATQGITGLLGPPLGGLLYGASRMLPFVTDALSYLVSVLSLSCIRVKFQQERTTAPRQLYREMAEGLTWLWHQPLIRFMAMLSCGINFIIAGVSLIVIVLAQHQHASSLIIGLIFAGGGIGGILGSLLAPFLQKRLSFGQAIISLSWLLVLLWPLYVIAPNLVVLGTITAAIYLLGPIYNVVNVSYRLALIPDAFQGRANSAIRMISFASQPLGLAATGMLIQSIGAVATVLAWTAVLVFVAGAATVNPHVRHARPLAEVHQA